MIRIGLIFLNILKTDHSLEAMKILRKYNEEDFNINEEVEYIDPDIIDIHVKTKEFLRMVRELSECGELTIGNITFYKLINGRYIIQDNSGPIG